MHMYYTTLCMYTHKHLYNQSWLQQVSICLLVTIKVSRQEVPNSVISRLFVPSATSVNSLGPIKNS